MSDSDDEDVGTGAAEMAAMLQPLRKQLKKHSSRIEKMETSNKEQEKRRVLESEQLVVLQQTVGEMNATLMALKESFNSRPWQPDIEKTQADLRATEKRQSSAVDDLRVQLTAHAQVR